MAKHIAVVDTSVLALLLSKPGPTEGEAVRVRRERAEVELLRLRKEGARFVVPTPVVAELYRDGKGTDIIRTKLVRYLKRTKIEALTSSSADIAGQMSAKALATRPPGEARTAVKYDALIAAIAHDIGARWLVTDNRPDMQRCLVAVASTVELIVTSAIPNKGQLSLVHQKAPLSPPGQAESAPQAPQAAKRPSSAPPSA